MGRRYEPETANLPAICDIVPINRIEGLMQTRHVFITGGTGFMGKGLIPLLLQRGHEVHALVREGSEGKLPYGCGKVVGNALDRTSFEHHIRPADTFVHLVGVAHPGPGKAEEFRKIDLGSTRESVAAAKSADVKHFVYLSAVQQPQFMKAYVTVRAEGEAMIRESGMNATFLRPWYVLGPGRRWPLLLLPAYWILEKIPATREKALQFGLVTLDEMLRALVHAVEHPPEGVRIMEVEAIKGM